jgi:hypothetical protein
MSPYAEQWFLFWYLFTNQSSSSDSWKLEALSFYQLYNYHLAFWLHGLLLHTRTTCIHNCTEKNKQITAKLLRRKILCQAS